LKKTPSTPSFVSRSALCLAKSFWGKPIKASKAAVPETGEEGADFKMFPMCCIFNANQVEPMKEEGLKNV
jgi:hypothetical protein